MYGSDSHPCHDLVHSKALVGDCRGEHVLKRLGLHGAATPPWVNKWRMHIRLAPRRWPIKFKTPAAGPRAGYERAREAHL